MAVTSYKFPTAEGQINSDWINAANVYADDAAYASTNSSATYDQQDFYHFDIASDDIPDGATILGVELVVSAHADGAAATITARLVIGGSAAGDTKSLSWTTESAMTDMTAGGATDMWGNSISRAQVLEDNFGVWFDTTVAMSTTKVDFVKIRIYYSTSTAYSRNVAVGVALASSNVRGVGKVVSASLGIDKSGHSGVTAYKNPSDNGDISNTFTNPEYAYTSNNQRATADATITSIKHDYTGFGFTTADIPSGCTINGFEVSIEALTGANFDPQNIGVYMVKGGVEVGSLANDLEFTLGTDAIKVLGSSTDLGYLNTWTDSDIRAANFGVELLVSNEGAQLDVCSIDHIKLRVYWSFPSVSFLKGIGKTCSTNLGVLCSRTLTIGKPILASLTLSSSKVISLYRQIITVTLALASHKHMNIVRQIAIALGLTPSAEKHKYESYPGPTPGTGTGEKVILP